MKMKRMLCLFLAVLTFFSMTACNSTKKEEGSESKETDATEDVQEENTKDGEEKTIQIMWPETDSTQIDVMENYIQPALAENFPDITFEYIPVSLNTDNPLKTLSASGDLPEIWYTSGDAINAILTAGDALDVSEYVEKDGWLEANYSNPELLYNGDAIYFLTPGQNAYYSPAFYYNKALFEANGIAEPGNMDELVAACQTFIDAGITPITTAQWVSCACLVSGVISAASPEAFKGLNDRTVKWTDDSVKEALGYIDKLKMMGAFAADIVNKDDATAYAEFQAGNTAMMLTYSWFNGDMVTDKLGFEAGYFSFPNSGDDYIQLIFEPRKGCGGGYTGNANYEDPELLADILKVIVKVESTRHNENGIKTNFIVENPAQPANSFEEERFADYDRAESQISVLCQGQMDGTTFAEFTTLYNMLISDDKDYLSANFVEEMQPVWEANSYGPEE